MKLLKNGAIIDPSGMFSGKHDILVTDGVITRIAPAIDEPSAEVIDLAGLTVAPGFIDLHVHFRDPGYEYKEDVVSGLRAAAAGGFTTVVCMPNTKPAIDTASVVRYIKEKAAAAALGTVLIAGSISKGREGQELAEIGDMFREGIVAVTDDGAPVTDAGLMRRILEYTKIFDLPVMCHPEVLSLVGSGAMHEGYISTMLGVPPIPAEAEYIMVQRDIALASLTGGRLHITHASTAESIAAVRAAKKAGLRVTCDVTPHHLALTDEAVTTFDTATKVNPPLRPQAHIDALVAGILDGTVDAIASDHAPHAVHEKEDTYANAPFGLIGLETSFAVLNTKLVREGVITIEKLVEKWTAGPATAFGLDAGRIAEGAPADIVAFDTEAQWTVDPSKFESKSRNCPWAGESLFGKVMFAMSGGRIINKDGVVTNA